MQVFETPSRIIVTCYGRLSPYLQQEVLALGYKIVRPFATGVELYGTVKDCIRLNLRLRTASQVLYSLKDFRCDHPDELYRALLPIPWEELLEPSGYFSVTSNVFHPSINNSMFANVRVKDAIVDRMRRKTGERPSTGADLNGAVIYLYWKDRSAEVFLDTSGETLAKHGYRKLPGKAPMLESLAASTILASQWDRRSPFVNPMCGAGTLAIEAALIATERFPGLLRSNYAFMHLPDFKKSMYERERALLDSEIKAVPRLHIIASDNSPDAIKVSNINAAAAGVDQLIEFTLCDFMETEVPEGGQGAVFFNPEYGERLGEVAELENTYSRLGDFMKQRCGGYMGYIFTGNLDLAKKIGLRAKRRIEFYNGKIDCRLLEFELYAGSRRAKVPGE